MKFIHSINFIKSHSGKGVRMKLESLHNGIKSVHITAFVSSYDSFKDITKQNQIGIKSVHITAFDYEMHEFYDAFSYSKHQA